MKNIALMTGILFCGYLSLHFALGKEPLPDEKTVPSNTTQNAAVDWGKAEDPDKDCEFTAQGDKLAIRVPGGNSHDLSAELGKMNSPRSLQEIEGDFKIEVTVDGNFEPGGDSSQEGRSGYNGACLLLMMDEQNYLRLERATLHWSGSKAAPYINYELRENGVNTGFGSTGDTALKPQGPTVLRIERKGNFIRASVSNDGIAFVEMPSKSLPSTWPVKIKVGVAAVSTSKKDFTPVFSGLKIEKSSKP